MRPDPYQKKASRQYQAKHASSTPQIRREKALPSNHDRYEEVEEVVDDRDVETEELMEMLAKSRLTIHDTSKFEFKEERQSQVEQFHVNLLELGKKLDSIPLWKKLGLSNDGIYQASKEKQVSKPDTRLQYHIKCSWITDATSLVKIEPKIAVENKGAPVQSIPEKSLPQPDFLEDLLEPTFTPKIIPKQQVKKTIIQTDEDFFNDLLK